MMNDSDQGQAPRPTTLDEVRHLGAIALTSPVKPNAAAVLGIGRATAYEQARAGLIPTVRVGRRVLVPVPALLRMLCAAENGSTDNGESDVTPEAATG